MKPLNLEKQEIRPLRFPVSLQQIFPKFYLCIPPTSSHVTTGCQVLKWPALERKRFRTHASTLALQTSLNYTSCPRPAPTHAPGAVMSGTQEEGKRGGVTIACSLLI